MSTKQIPTGKFIEEDEIVAVELRNSKGTLVNIFNYGVILSKFIVKNNLGENQDIVLGFDDIDGYLTPDYLSNYPYLGAVIGRYANRIGNAEFELGGNTYRLAANDGPVCLHGGLKGFDQKIWNITAINEDEAVFEYLSPDGEEGFPGNLTVLLAVKLTEENELILNFKATTDADTALNLTHHSYFNLNQDGGSVAGHLHSMPASFYLEQDENVAVTGNLIPVKGTALDFTTAKPIGRDWQPGIGYDQSFILDKAPGTLSLASSTESENGHLVLDIFTTEPVAHFYTSMHLNVRNAKAGKTYQPFDAFCVETQQYPNAVNIQAFPNTILKAGTIYRQTTVYKIG